MDDIQPKQEVRGNLHVHCLFVAWAFFLHLHHAFYSITSIISITYLGVLLLMFLSFALLIADGLQLIHSHFILLFLLIEHDLREGTKLSSSPFPLVPQLTLIISKAVRITA